MREIVARAAQAGQENGAARQPGGPDGTLLAQMDTQELDQALRATLEDGRLSRSERQALNELLREAPLDASKLGQLRARAFALAKERLVDAQARAVLEWTEDFVKLLAQLD